MAKENTENQHELGRRLGQQGPRHAVVNQAADDKLATGDLNILQCNICGIRNKKIELAKTLNEQNIHIALLQETLHRNVDPQIAGYTPYPCKCKDCRGVITYIRNDTQGKVTNITSEHPTDLQKVTIWRSGSKYTLFNVYNPPGTDCKLSFITQPTFSKTALLGDFNGHSPRWGYTDHNSTGRHIEDTCDTTNLEILQDENSPPTLLHRAHNKLYRPDLTIISADLLHRYSLEVLNGIGSDHLPILLTIAAPEKRKPELKTRWNFKKARWGLYKEETNQLLSEIPIDLPVNEYSLKFQDIILKAAANFIPRGSRNNYKPFWNKEIEKAVKDREACRKEMESNPTPENKAKLNKAGALAKRTIKQSKQSKWTKTVEALDMQKSGKGAWTLLSNLSGNKRRTNPKPLVTGNETIVEQQKKAEAFNKHFASINKSTKRTEQDRVHARSLKEKEHASGANSQVFEEDFSLSELQKAMKKLKNQKSPGPDKVHNEMLTKLDAQGKTTLLNLINKSWQEGTTPKAWKNALITPILKKGKPEEEMNSYRPISLTSCVGKIAERMINNRLCWWLESHKILDPNQAGFRPGQRTDDQIFRLSQRILDGFQRGESTTAVFVDFQQAYDRVWRKGLFSKMLEIGIHGKLYRWVKNFLTDRTIQTKIHNGISSKEILEEGLPQGSALSCTLFLIFVNDLPTLLETEKAMYADDLAIWHTSKHPVVSARRINQDLKFLHDYCEKWKIKINCSKTVYTIFTKSNKIAKRTMVLTIGQSQLKKVENPTYLGIEMDVKMTLNNHVDNLKKKANKRLKLLKRLASTSWGADKNTLRQLYIGYIRSILDYNIALQSICSKTNQESIDKIQNQAARFISGAMKSTPTAACEIHTNLEPLKYRREAAVLEMTERFKRMDPTHPNRKLVDGWKNVERINQKSILSQSKKTGEKHHLPENRENICLQTSFMPPFNNLKQATIETSLQNNATKQSSDLVSLKRVSEDKINEYSNRIHAYTDGSALKGTLNAGYGIRIEYPDNSLEELNNACGHHCSNFEAEALAIEATLQHLKNVFTIYPEKVRNLAIFSDSKSVLEALYHNKLDNSTCRSLALTIDNFLKCFKIDVTIQWIPGHTDIYGNECADKLAKAGSSDQQHHRPISQHTARQMIKANVKEEWLNEWAIQEGQYFDTCQPQTTKTLSTNCPVRSRSPSFASEHNT